MADRGASDPYPTHDALLAFRTFIADNESVAVADVQVTLKKAPSAAVSWTRDLLGIHATLWLPQSSLEPRASCMPQVVLAGMLLHEAAHVLYTPPDFMVRLAHEGGAALAQTANGLEDPRIERLAVERGRAKDGDAIFRALSAYLSRNIAVSRFDVTDPRNRPFLVAFLGRHFNNGTVDPDLGGALWAKCPAWLQTALRYAFHTTADDATAEDVAQAARDLCTTWDLREGGRKPHAPGQRGV